ncbi:dnaj 1 mitochondrial-related [Holotrichia oblita]|nr:dnaj 1 mitochondrial-related [Holotrichia oblita]
MAKSFYDILGVPKDASSEEIKKSYRKLARENHPDLHPGDKAAAERFKEISEAYDTLGDEKKRADYDNPASQAFNGFGGGGGFGGSGFSGGFSGFGGGGGGFFDDIINMFGGGGSGAQESGGDVITDITLTFEEAAFGATKEVPVTRRQSCGECSGTGAKDGKDYTKCATCGGSGVIQQVQDTLFGRMANQRSCPKCSGTGRIIKEKCTTCGGQGIIKVSTKIRLSFPAGLEDGQQVSVRGEGNSLKSGRKGDLFIHIKVLPHKYFKRDGLNLHVDYPITFIQAALGDKLLIDNLKGERVSVTIPEGTQHGTVFSIKGGGIELKHKKGDIKLKIVVEVPKNLSKEQKALLKSLDGTIKPNQYEKLKNFKI